MPILKLLKSKGFKRFTLIFTIVNMLVFVVLPFSFFGSKTVFPALKAADITLLEVITDNVPDAKMKKLEDNMKAFSLKAGADAARNVADMIPTYDAKVPPKQIKPNLERDTKGLFEYQQQLQQQGLKDALKQMEAISN